MQRTLDNVQPATDNVQHVSDNMQHVTDNMQHATDNMQHATDNMQHATDNEDVRYAPCSRQRAVCNLQHIMQHATCNIHHATDKRQQKTCNVQRPEAPFLSVTTHSSRRAATHAVDRCGGRPPPTCRRCRRSPKHLALSCSQRSTYTRADPHALPSYRLRCAPSE